MYLKTTTKRLELMHFASGLNSTSLTHILRVKILIINSFSCRSEEIGPWRFHDKNQQYIRSDVYAL